MEEMTASELLREADSNPCSMCRLVMDGDESCATTGCASWAYRLADKIDAELSQARELSLRQGAELWAKANEWPDFKPSEDFGAWLDRCAMPRPRFEDGEPVHIGDKAYHPYTGETCTIDCINTFDDSYCLGFVGERSAALLDGERVKRPAPEVLGADGKPIVEGETVYPTYGFYAGTSGKVVSVEHQDNVRVELCCSTERFDGCYITHTPPDTQQKIDDDATMPPAEYCAVRGIDLGDDPDRATATEAMVRDLLRRQRELDKRTGGAE